jgi:hypothetical protein
MNSVWPRLLINLPVGPRFGRRVMRCMWADTDDKSPALAARTDLLETR